jgi:hypothetical protein
MIEGIDRSPEIGSGIGIDKLFNTQPLGTAPSLLSSGISMKAQAWAHKEPHELNPRRGGSAPIYDPR